MNTDNVLSNISAGIQSYSPSEIITILLAALAGGLLIYLTYRFTSDSSVYNRSFNIGNVILSLLTAVIMMMIASNVIISLGMVGALSIVRFRTAVKEARDTVFLFWAIIHGLCAGSQNFMLAAISSLFICVVLFAFSLLGKSSFGSYTLVIRTEASKDAAIEKVLKNSVRNFRLRAANTTDFGTELVYRIRIAGSQRLSLLSHLKQLPGVTQANLSETQSF